MNILLTEDDPVNLLVLQGILGPLGHEVLTSVNAEEALALVAENDFDLLLLDVMMPDMDGLELTRRCRADPRLKDVPILLITALSTKADLVKGFEAGATDYVSKPFHSAELIYRVKVHLKHRSLHLSLEKTMNDLNLHALQVDRQQRELEAKEKELFEANRLLAEANRALLEFASKDSLTGLLNRRKGWDFMNYEEERARRTLKSIGVCLLDLDHFKTVNDTLVHEAGDLVLKTASQCLASTLRAADILIRWGGEEFLAVLPETDREALALVADKIRRSVEVYPWDLKDGRKITVSVGTTLKLPDDPWDQVVEKADRALYQAKEAGRNRVDFAP